MRISDWSSDVCSSDLRDGRIQTSENVGIGDARLLRRPVGLAGQRHEAAHRLNDEVVTGAVRIGAGLAETGDRTDDQAREVGTQRSEEHTSELQSLMRISYAVFCLKKKKKQNKRKSQEFEIKITRKKEYMT